MTIEQEFREKFLNEKQVASLLGWTVKTLRNRRYDDVDHPPFIDRGKDIMYPKKDFFEWYCSGIKRAKKAS